jgi:hypothetical protein
MKNRPLECRFEATYAFIHYGPMTRSASFDGFVDGSRDSVSFLLTIQATGFLTVALVGLSPTVYASLRWTHLYAGLSRRTRFDLVPSLAESPRGISPRGAHRFRT